MGAVGRHNEASRSLPRRLVAEGVGTALLLMVIVGSGIMGERLADGSVLLALLANSIATGAGLVALILTFGPVSGAHFNPAVTLSDAAMRGIRWSEAAAYIVVQIVGAVVGTMIANVMFDLPAVEISGNERTGGGLFLGELVATAGLLATIWGCVRRRVDAVPFAVGAYITAAMWFTSSTSFANPAVTIARTLTATFTGIAPADAPLFIVAQLVGAAAVTLLFAWLVPPLEQFAGDVVVPHGVHTKGEQDAHRTAE